MTIRNLSHLLAPQSIALIGASGRDGSVGKVLTQNLVNGGFSGPIWGVNPKASSINGIDIYRQISDLPEPPDLGVVAIPPQHVTSAIGQLSERGARAAVVITAGLDQSERQAMLSAGESVMMRIQGPNCLGLMLPPIGLNASFSHIAPTTGDIAFLSQSGALILAVVDWAAGRGIGFSHVVSLGDMADVDFGDMLDYLAADSSSRAILLYIENIKHAAKFMSAARRAARVKPVVAIKAGRHEAAARAAFSHTGALAGADHAYEAAFRRAGVVRVETLQDLFDAAEVLTRVPPLKGDRLTIITNGGGAGILATDRLADIGGVLADLPETTRNRLDRALPKTWSKANPIDIIGDAGPERYVAALEAVLDDPDCDCILAINCPTALASSTNISQDVIRTYQTRRDSRVTAPLLTNWLGDAAGQDARRNFLAANIPTFETPADAINAHGVLVSHRRAQMELSQTPPSQVAEIEPAQISRAEEILSAALARNSRTLSELDSKRLLDCYGIPIVPTEFAQSPADARRISETYFASYGSCVVKVAAEGITHKSDIGGVRLDLTSPRSVEDAATNILNQLAQMQDNLANAGVVVQPMIKRPHAIELIAGMSIDDTFGPLMMFGAGGTSVEVMNDTASALPPLDGFLAREMISRTRVSRLLAGYRDRPPANMTAIVDTLVRLSHLISNHPKIRELDINPLLADQSGVIALDARVKLVDDLRSQRKPMSIRPYPNEWQVDVEVTPIGKVLFRPVRPTDEKSLSELLTHVSGTDLRTITLGQQDSLEHQTFPRLAQIDYAREMTFVALANSTGELMAVIRMLADPDYEKAQFGITVHPELKESSLGRQLCQQLITYARDEGIRQLYGSIERTNTPLLDFCAEAGFSQSVSPDNPSQVDVNLWLN